MTVRLEKIPTPGPPAVRCYACGDKIKDWPWNGNASGAWCWKGTLPSGEVVYYEQGCEPDSASVGLDK